MDFADLTSRSTSELHELIAEHRATLHTLRLKAHSGQLKQVHKIALARKDLARLLTALAARLVKKMST